MSWSGLPERIERKIIPEPNSGCWLWSGTLYTTGYGRTVKTVNKHKQYILAHRFVFEMLRTSIQKGLELDHLCRMRCCVNPDHLEPVTPKINKIRGMGVGGINTRKTHCKRGHLLEGSNIYSREGYSKRHCVICNRAGNALRYRKKTL